ncbi:hypothetical protein FQN57_005537, partial [Myotisia sp. PD_48]
MLSHSHFKSHDVICRSQTLPQEVATVGAAILQSNSVKADLYTQLLTKLKEEDHVFRIPCAIRTNTGIKELRKDLVQADQGSDMNVITRSMAEALEIPIQSLAAIDIHIRTL